MKLVVFLACAAATLTMSAPAAVAAPAKSAHSARPAARDWTKVVSATPAGGFVMGNPAAKVKLIEFGSMTCPHCRAFDQQGVPGLVDGYVRTGQVSYEFRNYVRDASDIAASLVARCSGPGKFFAFTRALYAEQPNWQGKVEDVPQDQLNAIQNLPPEKEFFEIAKAAGLPQWAASRGLPAAKTTQCLTNEASIKRLIQITKDAKTQFPDFRGTPRSS